jgi:tRNA A37 threonylcarbamoyladenosine modification protein TsaB
LERLVAQMGLKEKLEVCIADNSEDELTKKVVDGPGGFTSLRVGVATANALSDALGIPSVGIHLSDLYRAKIPTPNPEIPMWMHSTKKNELFIRESASDDPQHITLDQLPGYLKKGGGWTGELIPDQRAIVEEAGMTEAALRSLADVLPDFLTGLEYKKQILHPWYGRGW